MNRLQERAKGDRAHADGPGVEHLADWVSLGLISKPQADAISAYEVARSAGPAGFAPPQGEALEASRAAVTASSSPVAPSSPTAPARMPAAAEALGYLGGILAVAGAGLLIGRRWREMSSTTHLSILGAVAVGLLVAGALVPRRNDAALERLRGFVWLLGCLAVGGFAGFVAYDIGDARDPKAIASIVAGSIAVVSGVLWLGRARPFQQFTCLVASVVCAAVGVGQVARGGITGAVVWLLGAVIFVVGVRRLLAQPMIAEVVGAAAALIGGALVSGDLHAVGLLLTTATGIALVGYACVEGAMPHAADRRMVLTVAFIGLLRAIPSTVIHFSNRAGIATGLVVWALGVALVFAGSLERVRLSVAITVVGGFAIVGGAAITGTQAVGFATVFGLVTAVALIAAGMTPQWVLMSIFGSLGLLVNVPWAINWFFPGKGRAPVLILVSGAVIVAVAVVLTRTGGRIRNRVIGHH